MINYKIMDNKLKNKSTKFIIKKIFKKIYDLIHDQFREVYIKNFDVSLKDKYFVDFETSMVNFFDLKEIDYYIHCLVELKVQNNILNDSEKILAHKFNFLGMNEIYLGECIQWNKDYKSGFVWGNKFYKKIRKVNLNNDADIKYPWELSRFQHLFTLGEAYWITKDEKYPIEFRNQILDWIAMNPVEMSVNWTCTMDVAIRSVNWITASNFFKASNSLDEKFWIKFNKSLYNHGRFIYNNLENKGSHTNNHYLSNLCGLIWISLYFNRSNKIVKYHINNNPKRWLIFGINNLVKEMFVEVNNDGTSYEGSTSYHRLLAEIFLLTASICKKNNINMSSDYNNRLEKMCDFISCITKPNYLSPLIGDADDGRLLILSNYYNWKRNDFTYILSIASNYFSKIKFYDFNSIFLEDLLWINGKCKKDNLPQKLKQSEAFIDGGFYILRNDNFYIFIRCGELSYRGQGGHSHNDQLSFELNVNGIDFIVDPGSYVYTSDFKSRNLFRCTNNHNTVYIKGIEQNTMIDKDIFTLNEETFSKCLLFTSNKFKGYHNGFSKKCGIVHKREIEISETVLTIKDILEGSIENKDIYLNFILHEDVIPALNKNEVILLNGKEKIVIAFDSDDISISYSKISYNYGQTIDTKKISVKVNSNISYTRILTNI